MSNHENDSAAEDDPYVVTLMLNKGLQQRLNELRQKYYPADLNYLDAHVTLFHALPASWKQTVVQDLEAISAETTAFQVTVREPRQKGSIVMLPLQASPAYPVHSTLQAKWQEHLTTQDQRKFFPHVTICHKVSEDRAKEVATEASAEFSFSRGRATGLALYRYKRGPWELYRRFMFKPR